MIYNNSARFRLHYYFLNLRFQHAVRSIIIYERRYSWWLRSERFLKGKVKLNSLFFEGMNALF